MHKYLTTLFLCLAFSLTVYAQKRSDPVPLRIEGDTILVVKSLPFKVIAPEGADDYTWILPDGVKGEESDNVLNITKAPNGTFVIKVKMTTIDFEAKKVKKQTGEVSVILGSPPDPKPPDPPTPDDPLTKRLKDAYQKDTTTSNKSNKIRLLSDIYLASSKMNLAMTGKELFTALRKAVELAGLTDNDLRPVRVEIQTELQRIMPTDTSTKLSTEEQLITKSLFEKIGSSLLKVAVQEKLR